MTLFRLCRLLNFIKARLDSQVRSSGEFDLCGLLDCAILPDGLPLAGEIYIFPRKLTEVEIGGWLLRTFLRNHLLLGMRLRRRKEGRVTYEVFEEATSVNVIRLFIAQSAGRPVCGVKHASAFVILDYDCEEGNDIESESVEPSMYTGAA